MPSLTAHLLHLDPPALTAAITHPFLTAAATQTLPLPALKRWLAQDRLYQHAYIPFLGSLLAHTSISSTTPALTETLEWRTVDLLIDALANIRSEMKLFDDIAAAEGWLEELCSEEFSRPEVATRAYRDLFAGATARGRPLVVGLTALWATEEAYLRSWRFAGTCVDYQGMENGTADVMVKTFIPNWSSPEFEAFVRRIGGLVDRFAELYEPGGWEWKECEVVYRQVLVAEREFWPKVGGEGGGGRARVVEGYGTVGYGG